MKLRPSLSLAGARRDEHAPRAHPRGDRERGGPLPLLPRRRAQPPHHGRRDPHAARHRDRVRGRGRRLLRHEPSQPAGGRPRRLRGGDALHGRGLPRVPRRRRRVPLRVGYPRVLREPSARAPRRGGRGALARRKGAADGRAPCTPTDRLHVHEACDDSTIRARVGRARALFYGGAAHAPVEFTAPVLGLGPRVVARAGAARAAASTRALRLLIRCGVLYPCAITCALSHTWSSRMLCCSPPRVRSSSRTSAYARSHAPSEFPAYLEAGGILGFSENPSALAARARAPRVDEPVLDGAARRLAAVRPLHEPRDELGAEQHEHLVRAARAVRATPAPGEERGPQLHPRGPGGRAVRATPAPDDDRQAAAAAGRARPRRRLGRGAVEPAEVRARRRARPDDRVPRLAG